MDEVDRKIIEALRKDARTPFTEIGKKLGISDATVHFRVRKMLKADVIRKYTVVINERMFRRNVTGYVLMKVKSGSIEDISKRLVKIEGVVLVQELHGVNNILIKIGAMDLESLRDLIMKVQVIPNIVESEYFTILKTWKE